ncbi:ArsR/SmtB family transcription factor [Cryobacterium psychrophilum]|uniref:ArsR family transcriptional regulator n=1 Tax=Cryobacterium psychrophilum TaxID=41988 RepID=A0A4Y8KP15_9MICO|nr:metalloregulator ArsR/SmtB family transcription factor [Cryobacterium psychrophilum]TDW30381.1 ArsR family transcriptional regulator [Cryobacterium psychrophilum]TFD79071.1 ArsR family transcriptional regulator [Cryobacterium psychrophilum]
MADIFDVVADSTRRDILRILLDRHNQGGEARGELSVSDIVGNLGLSQPTVSKHLKVLRESGLVSVREEGQHRYYHLDYSPLEAIEDWLIPFLSVDFDTDEEAQAAEEAGLRDEQRAFASAIGKAFADTSYQMSHAVKDATAKKWRKNI